LLLPVRALLSVGVIVILLAPAVGATPAPTELTASYDEQSQELSLSWTQSSGDDVAGWRVYRDDSLVASPTSVSFTDDLSAWSGGEHYYSVTAVDFNGVESRASNTVYVTKTPIPPGGGCPIVTVIISSLVPPQVYPGINEECIPL
jgi:chitinase